MKCSRCKIEALPGQAFVPKLAISAENAWLCSNCQQRQLRRFFAGIYIAASVAILAGLATLYYSHAPEAAWLLIEAASLPWLFAISTILHELGHATGACLGGIAVERLKIGMGPPLFRIRLPGFPVMIHQIPVNGMCQARLTAERKRRWPLALYVAGGPGANLLVSSAVWIAGQYAFFETVQRPLVFDLWALFWINLLLGFGSLAPYSTLYGGQLHASDGLILGRLRSSARPGFHHFRQAPGASAEAELASSYPDSEREEMADCLYRFEVAAGIEDFESAQTLLEALAAKHPSHPAASLCAARLAAARGDFGRALALAEALNPAVAAGSETRMAILHLRWLCLAHLGRHAEIRVELEGHLADEPEAQRRMDLLDKMACLPFMDNVAGYCDEALRWVDRALQMQPGNLTLLGTKGVLLAELGQWDEAIGLLSYIRSQSESDNDQSIVSFYLAWWAKKRREDKSALRLAKRCRDLGPAPWLKRRLAKEFPNLG